MEEPLSPWGPIPSDFAPTVRAHMQEAVAYLVADSGPCLEVRDAEVQRIQRNLVPVRHDQLQTLELRRYRVVAFLICAMEEYRRFLEWSYDRSWEESRRVFLYVPQDGYRVFSSQMVEHRSRFPLRWFDEFGSFHKQFGSQFNHRIYLDAKESEGEA